MEPIRKLLNLHQLHDQLSVLVIVMIGGVTVLSVNVGVIVQTGFVTVLTATDVVVTVKIRTVSVLSVTSNTTGC